MYSNFTLLQLLGEMDLSLNASEISKLGIDISKYARANGIRYTKIRQVENAYSVRVNHYPFECKYILRRAVNRYLEPRRKRHKRIRGQRV